MKARYNWNRKTKIVSVPLRLSSTDSVDELIDNVSQNTINEIIEFIEETENDKGQFRELISDIQNDSLFIPYHQGKEMSYQNKEGFSNIILSPSDLYDNPWIKYFPDEKQSGIRFISIMSLSDDINTRANRSDISKLISEIDTNAPNIDNYYEFESYKKIYISEIQLSGSVVNALIYEYKEDNRIYIKFAYDEVLVSILTFNEKAAYDWLKDFSFAKERR